MGMTFQRIDAAGGVSCTNWLVVTLWAGPLVGPFVFTATFIGKPLP